VTPPVVSALSRCVGPVETFMATFWGRVPFYKSGADPGAFADLFSSLAVDRVLHTTSARLSRLRLVKDGETLDPCSYLHQAPSGPLSEMPDIATLYGHFWSGATITLNGLQRYWPPLSRFCSDLERDLTHPIQANAYITPESSRGLAEHYDNHDVFVLQVSGVKHWDIYGEVKWPVPSQPRQEIGDTRAPQMEFDLEPGDCLYIPRGFVHAARTMTSTSIHLTVGVLAVVWHDILQEVLEDVLDEETFREALPAGFANEDGLSGEEVRRRLVTFARWLMLVNPDEIVRRLQKRFWFTRAPNYEGQLAQLSALGSLTDRSRVRVRTGVPCTLEQTEDNAYLIANLVDRNIRMPNALEPAMRAILSRQFFRISDLARFLDKDSRLVLVRRLVREGLLECVDSSMTD
jgi:lysine-specific demethylase/histidyl-hydroxylase NO66